MGGLGVSGLIYEKLPWAREGGGWGTPCKQPPGAPAGLTWTLAHPHPLLLAVARFAPSPRLFSRTIRDLCWRPKEPRSWLAAEEATSWIPECEVCRKALSFGDGRDPVVSMALDKQEETVRESRYFTALKAYKHGARGRKSRCLWSKPDRGAAPTPLSREPGGAQLPGRSEAPRQGLPRGQAVEKTAPPRLLVDTNRPPFPNTRQVPVPSRCRERLRSDWGTAIPSASWGLWTKNLANNVTSNQPRRGQLPGPPLARAPSGLRLLKPGAKRRHSCAEALVALPPGASPQRSRSPSPQPSSHVAPQDHGAPAGYPPVAGSAVIMDALNSLATDSPCGIPPKMWKTSPDPSPVSAAPSKAGLPRHIYPAVEFLGPCEQGERRNSAPESILLVPPTWPKPLVPAIPICSIPVTASLPPLEWPLSSQSGSYELRIEVQPKPHHRAHYETEGSRGAVKAPTGGHPVVQLHGYMENKPLGLQIFIGTADERILKPHAFYQVHRITGKTVTTTSYEKIVGNTKVLEIPLEPKNNMRATIDCAGILKLRNADIELRKGETDIGRKNTRVRLVFRVHIPESSGRIVSLQTASNPIECSQRSAHELPMVERQDTDSCLVYGGQQMILTGQNFTAESKVVFTEKTTDGQQIWEMEATVDKDKSQPNMLFVEIPEYRNKHIRTPVKVNFYVINGKRKRSQPQHFTYHPVPAIKTEPTDEYDPTLICSPTHGGLGSQPYYPQHPMVAESPSCLVATMAPCQQFRTGLSSPDARYQQQNPAAVLYQRSKSLSPSLLGYQQPALMAAPLSLADAHRSVLVHAGSQGQSSALLHPSPTNQQASPVIHYSPTNQQLRCGSHQEFQHIMYCENFAPGTTRPGPPPVSQGQRLSPGSYPTVIQQQNATSQRAAKNGPPVSDQKEVLPAGVTIKQEQNLDQTYLDDELIDTHLSWIQNIL
uniref:Nuclear factor of activated T cells 2 n=1 Tax=Macaca fascicularis TaxID=9541 RepID=A0A2K5VQQ4_MACFA